ncbi:MAG TPA: hypothetical protein VGO04_29345 [Ensifer sp.]|jgi:hypothetical protein|uniref:hypothetical protein n=1 Tax=Ensifer sp. TaxID=1872086 RepID=UPI002E1645B5|nr:hypothetical protein [Ensifer sp.]
MNEAAASVDAKAERAAADVPKQGRLARAVPSLRVLVVGAPLWSASMALSAWYGLWLRERALTFHLAELLWIFGLGALLAWPPALFLARLTALGRGAETRFAAYLLFLSLGTIGMTALLFALDYREFYAQWHAPVGTRTWLFQFAFTTAIAFYQFLVMGLRLYLPVGGVILLGASLWLASRRSQRR